MNNITNEQAEYFKSIYKKRIDKKGFNKNLKRFIDAGVSYVVYYDDELIVLNNLNYFYSIFNYVHDPKGFYYGYILKPDVIIEMINNPLEYWKYSYDYINTHEQMDFVLSKKVLSVMVEKKDNFVNKTGSMVDFVFEIQLKKMMEQREKNDR